MIIWGNSELLYAPSRRASEGQMPLPTLSERAQPALIWGAVWDSKDRSVDRVYEQICLTSTQPRSTLLALGLGGGLMAPKRSQSWRSLKSLTLAIEAASLPESSRVLNSWRERVRKHLMCVFSSSWSVGPFTIRDSPSGIRGPKWGASKWSEPLNSSPYPTCPNSAM